MKIDITVPVLNEEDELEENILKLHDFLMAADADISWKIIIADNGSTDKTGEIGSGLSKEYPGDISYFRLPERGVGRALKKSWRSSTADIVGYMDLDLSTDLSHILQAVSAIAESGYDLVYGSRLHRKSEVIGRSLKREIASRVFNLILKNYLKIEFSDGQCGFKFLIRSNVERLLENGAGYNGWFFATELLVAAEKQGLNICELPVKWTDTETSKVKVIPLALEYLKAIYKLKRRISEEYAAD